MKFTTIDIPLPENIQRLREELSYSIHCHQVSVRKSIDKELEEYFAVVHGVWGLQNIEYFMEKESKNFGQVTTLQPKGGYVEVFSYKGVDVLQSHINLESDSVIISLWR